MDDGGVVRVDRSGAFDERQRRKGHVIDGGRCKAFLIDAHDEYLLVVMTGTVKRRC